MNPGFMLKTRSLLSQVDWLGVHTLTQQVSLWLTLYIEGGGSTLRGRDVPNIAKNPTINKEAIDKKRATENRLV
jgi:hypothetical protein